MKTIIKYFIILCLFVGIANAAGPNLIVNGSFEADDFSDPLAFPNGFAGVNGTFIGNNYNNNTLTGWNFTTNLDGWIEGGNWAAAQDGKQYIDVMGNNTVYGTGSAISVSTNQLSQTINTQPGKSYTLSFYWGEDVGHTPPEQVILQVDVIDASAAVILNQVLTKASIGPIAGVRGPNTWEHFQQVFVATTAQTTIRFSPTPPGNGDTSAGAALDNVSVYSDEVMPVPTLSEWAIILLVISLGFLGYKLPSTKN